MREKFFRLFIGICGIIVFTTFAFVWKFIPVAHSQSPVVLFTLKESPKLVVGDRKHSPASVRESEIEFGFDHFASQDFVSLNLPLFDGKTYTATRLKFEGFENRGENSFTWRGKIADGEFRGDVVLTFNKRYVTGLIYSPKAVYEIVAKGRKHLLIELDQDLFPDCIGEIESPALKTQTNQNTFGGAVDSGDRIDVLVVYTEAVKNALGGDAQAQTLAQNAVDVTNTAFRNSKIRQRLRLVHSEQTALTEANNLSNLRNDTTTQTLRNTHNADMVAMLVNSLGGCGIGYLMRNVGAGFQGFAYTITLRTCAVGNLTFAHELGHNLGSTHNPKNASNTPAFPYSYGHYVSGNYRTVMSFSSQCTGGCTRVAQFSNPAIIYNNAATGILNGRNNHRSLENTSDVVSNFRYSGTSLTLSNYSENEFIPRNISRILNWTSDGFLGNVKIELSRDEGSTWETLIEETPNDGSQAINVGGRPTRRSKIRISSVNNSVISDSSVKNISIK